MPRKQVDRTAVKEKIVTLDQVSAGGVAFRRKASGLELAVVCVKPKLRWQLPKGIVDPGESPEAAALREVREEAGVQTERLALVETIEYWYRSLRNGKPVRYHKFVHFYLLQYLGGNVSDHDHEVEEARWVSFKQALELLEFESERSVVQKAREMIEAGGRAE